MLVTRSHHRIVTDPVLRVEGFFRCLHCDLVCFGRDLICIECSRNGTSTIFPFLCPRCHDDVVISSLDEYNNFLDSQESFDYHFFLSPLSCELRM